MLDCRMQDHRQRHRWICDDAPQPAPQAHTSPPAPRQAQHACALRYRDGHPFLVREMIQWDRLRSTGNPKAVEGLIPARTSASVNMISCGLPVSGSIRFTIVRRCTRDTSAWWASNLGRIVSPGSSSPQINSTDPALAGRAIGKRCSRAHPRHNVDRSERFPFTGPAYQKRNAPRAAIGQAKAISLRTVQRRQGTSNIGPPINSAGSMIGAAATNDSICSACSASGEKLHDVAPFRQTGKADDPHRRWRIQPYQNRRNSAGIFRTRIIVIGKDYHVAASKRRPVGFLRRRRSVPADVVAGKPFDRAASQAVSPSQT